MSAVLPRSRLWGEDLGEGNLLGKSQGKTKQVWCKDWDQKRRAEVRLSPRWRQSPTSDASWITRSQLCFVPFRARMQEWDTSMPHWSDISEGLPWRCLVLNSLCSECTGPAAQGHPRDSRGRVGVPASGGVQMVKDGGVPSSMQREAPGTLSPPKLCLQPWALSHSTLASQYMCTGAFLVILAPSSARKAPLCRKSLASQWLCAFQSQVGNLLFRGSEVMVSNLSFPSSTQEKGT